MSKLSGKFIIDPKSGCWTWTGPVNNNGYGRTGGQYAHRIAYTEANGEIPPGLTIDHLCRNRRCVNPDHLEAVTHLENVRRKPGLATETHCRNGHRWTEATLYVATGGRRRCRKCRLETLARVTDRRRLTVEQVALIREARATGAKGREIADLAKVSMRTVWRVLNGQLGHGGFA